MDKKNFIYFLLGIDFYLIINMFKVYVVWCYSNYILYLIFFLKFFIIIFESFKKNLLNFKLFFKMNLIFIKLMGVVLIVVCY